HAVATGLRDLPDDRVEQVRRDAAERQSGTDHADEILATAAPRDGLVRRRVADRAGRRRNETGRETRERPGGAREREREGGRGGRGAPLGSSVCCGGRGGRPP